MKNTQDPKELREFSCMDDAPINTGSNQEDYNSPRNWGEEEEENDDDVWGSDYDENTERFD